METKTALITGATSGIGTATAQILANNNIPVVICGRRKNRLAALKKELEPKVKTCALQFDIGDKKAVFEAINSIPKEFQPIHYLINNAGNAHGLDPIQDGDITDWNAMIDSNIKGLLYVSKAVMPQMKAQKAGHIINIGSLAGREVYPKGNVYCATKHAVAAITEGMRIDLNPLGIKVSSVSPGLVETEFSKVRFKGNAIADDVYKGFDALQAKDIAEIIYFTISRPAHVNLADVLILPTAQANSVTVHRK
ncbi:MAG: NAD(P)-dependent oxidoreductase [Flavobacteriales bacterium]|nr:MAG: NAD(P)-dependent oxidoreductase [Flavobacteriales bacterium]